MSRTDPNRMKTASHLALAFACAPLVVAQLPGPARPAAAPSSPVSIYGAPGGQAPSTAPPVQTGFSGSVPSGEAMPGMLDLSLREALNRGLKYNLAVVEGGQGIRTRRAQRQLALSQILPTLNLRPSVTEQQINLLAYGFPLPSGTPPVVGPFKVWDARGLFANNLSLEGWRNYRAGSEGVRAAELSLRDARDQVVEVVIQLYLQTIAASARITAVQAQVTTAEQLYRQAVDRRDAGTAPGIDVLRAQVEMQSQRQRLIAYEGDLDIQKLALARAIGLPPGQQFRLTEDVPYAPLPAGVSLETSLEEAYRSRSDYRAAEALVRAAELTVSGARAGRYPSISLNADYGVIGPKLEQLHGTFSVSGAVNIPVFEAGRVRANLEQAQAGLEQRKAEREDLRGRIDADVRTAFLNLRTAGRQVEVARSNLDLATQQLGQSQDRFAAGVTNNLEVVQAQEALAAANESLISSLYLYNSAKASLVRSRGESEEAVSRYLTGK